MASSVIPSLSDYMNMSPVGDSNTTAPPTAIMAPDPSTSPSSPTTHCQGPFKHTQRPGELEAPAPPAPPPFLKFRSTPLRCGRRRVPLRPPAAATAWAGDTVGLGQSLASHISIIQVLQAHLPQVDTAAQTNNRLARPTGLSLGDPKASTLPRAREQQQPPPLLLPPNLEPGSM